MKLSRYIPKDAFDYLVIGAIGAGVAALYVSVMGWPAWVPWSAEKKVPVLEAQVASQAEHLDAAAQQATIRDLSDARNSEARHTTIVIEDRTREYIRDIEAAPDAAARQRVFLERLCESPFYAADPACTAR